MWHSNNFYPWDQISHFALLFPFWSYQEQTQLCSANQPYILLQSTPTCQALLRREFSDPDTGISTTLPSPSQASRWTQKKQPPMCFPHEDKMKQEAATWLCRAGPGTWLRVQSTSRPHPASQLLLLSRRLSCVPGSGDINRRHCTMKPFNREGVWGPGVTKAIQEDFRGKEDPSKDLPWSCPPFTRRAERIFL